MGGDGPGVHHGRDVARPGPPGRGALSMELLPLLHHTLCGGVAAAGFGLLFHTRYRALPWCAASGGLALAVRTTILGWDGSLEAASFVAALTVGAASQLLQPRIGVSRDALSVAGCIPMVPG